MLSNMLLLPFLKTLQSVTSKHWAVILKYKQIHMDIGNTSKSTGYRWILWIMNGNALVILFFYCYFSWVVIGSFCSYKYYPFPLLQKSQDKITVGSFFFFLSERWIQFHIGVFPSAARYTSLIIFLSDVGPQLAD